MTEQAQQGGQFHWIHPQQTFGWHPGSREAAEEYGLKPEDVEKIVRSPQTIEWDPTRPAGSWPAERRSSGDVRVVVAFPPGARPVIWGVYVMSRLHGKVGSATVGSTAGSSGLSKVPTSMRELKRRLIAKGFTIEADRRAGHDKVLLDDKFFYTLATTPGEYRTLANTWANLRKKAQRKGIDL